MADAFGLGVIKEQQIFHGMASCWLVKRERRKSTMLAVGGLLQKCPFFQFMERLP
jgi:hypothetical protein